MNHTNKIALNTQRENNTDKGVEQKKAPGPFFTFSAQKAIQMNDYHMQQ